MEIILVAFPKNFLVRGRWSALGHKKVRPRNSGYGTGQEPYRSSIIFPKETSKMVWPCNFGLTLRGGNSAFSFSSNLAS